MTANRSADQAATAGLPKRLQLARKVRGLSQCQVAIKACLQPAAVSHFETGGRTPSFANLRSLADALGVSADYLLGRTDEMEGTVSSAIDIARRVMRLTDQQRAVVLNVISALRDHEVLELD